MSNHAWGHGAITLEVAFLELKEKVDHKPHSKKVHCRKNFLITY